MPNEKKIFDKVDLKIIALTIAAENPQRRRREDLQRKA